MNDRYLYRAKRTDNGEWVKGLLWKKKYNSNKIFISCFPDEDDNEEVFVVDKSTICQCTGLKDKNGKLIWENDIMCGHLDDEFPEDITYTKVLWNNNGFCTQEYCSSDIDPIDDFYKEHFEVCGNIFDNHEFRKRWKE